MAKAIEASTETEERVPPSGTRRVCGHKKDVPDERDWPVSAKFGAPRNLPPEALGLLAFVRRVNDQQSSEGCVGQALQKAIDTRLRKLGIPNLPEPSELAIYAIGRKVGGESPLEDAGCYPRDAMSGCRDVGVPAEEAWPFDLSQVNQDLPLSVLQDASRFLLFQWSRATSSGSARSDEIASALAKDYPVVFGLEIDEAFFSHESGTIEALGESRGGHMLCILGYRTAASGKREFRVINSWGESWGEHGYFWLGEDVLCSDRASDLYVIEVSP